MMNCTCWVKYAKWRIRWVILSLIDVDKWWAYVDDSIRDWMWLLCYVIDVITWGDLVPHAYMCWVYVHIILAWVLIVAFE